MVAFFDDQRGASRSTLQRLRQQADLTRDLLHSSRRLIDDASLFQAHIQDRFEWTGDEAERALEDERETRARTRLLQWEAEDLARLVPEELETEKRQFAISLYETIRLAASLGMSGERLRYQVEYARERYLQGE